ncbi:TonB-dependent receptor, partial [Phenylobacterium sp.]|uniref:TonB-dependent receptor n=1 Tax=Phenylobacterium sp. TaxID=1871053 RepID=UPI0025E0135F
MAGSALPAYGQAAAPKVAAKPKPPKPPHVDEDEDTTVSELVVTAAKERPQPGAVVGDIKPELQLGPAEIQSYGVSTVTELLDELAPEIRSDRGRGGEAPVVLLNGRRISGFNEIRDLPTEAILRVDILPEEVALKYGYAADQRVVNIVLRRRFRATTVEAGGGGATAGGQASGTAELDLLHIRGDNRLNLDLKASVASAITEHERGVAPLPSALPFDLVGNVTGLLGGEVDPALSALAGKPVTVAGLPAAAASRTLTLGDFAATAGMLNASDVGRYRTLTPETRSVNANAVVTRALGKALTGTLNATLGATSSDGLRGLPGVSLLVPGGGPFSPFGPTTVLDRYSTAFGPLAQDTEGWTGHLGGTLNRDLPTWRLSLTGAYDHANSLTRSDVGVDAATLQAAVTGRSVNPYAAFPDGLLSERGRNKARSDSDGVQVHALVSGPAFQAPAGPIYVSLRATEAASWLSSETLRGGTTQSVDLSRNTLSAQGSVDLPIASRSRKVLGFLGDLSINGNAAVNDVSDFGTLKVLGAGVNWRPLTGVTLIVSRTYDEAAPSMAQLGGPTVVTEAARIFDYATGQTVDVRRLDGGNAALIGDDRWVTKVGLTWKPLQKQDLTFTANYIKSRINNATETFPAATAEIEAAFPDRFLRNAQGQLIQVDYRPVNFAREDREELRWGFNYSRPIGPQPPPRRFGGRPGGGPPGGPGFQPPPADGPDARPAADAQPP